MELIEQELVENFRSLGQKFASIHTPNLTSVWNDVASDIHVLTGQVVGTDISDILELIERWAPFMEPLLRGFEEIGPSLLSHASNLEAAFSGMKLPNAAGSGGGSSGTVMGQESGSVWHSIEGVGENILSTLVGDFNKIDKAFELFEHLPQFLAGPLKDFQGSKVGGFLVDLGKGPLGHVLGDVSAGLSGIEIGFAVHDIMTGGWTQSNTGNLISNSGWGLIGSGNPFAMAAGGGMVVGPAIESLDPNWPQDSWNGVRIIAHYGGEVPGIIANTASGGLQDIEAATKSLASDAGNFVSGLANDLP
jgi:hypothetical protein